GRACAAPVSAAESWVSGSCCPTVLQNDRSGDAALPEGFIAAGRVLLALELTDVTPAPLGAAEVFPSENPIPKKTAHSATRPKNIASIFPVPRVISLSSEFAISQPRCCYESPQPLLAAGEPLAPGCPNIF